MENLDRDDKRKQGSTRTNAAISALIPMARAGKIRIFVQTTPSRLYSLIDIPIDLFKLLNNYAL